MIKIILCLILMATSLSIIGQDAARDSLLKLVSASKTDTAKVRLYLKISELYERVDLKETMQYAKKADAISRSIKYGAGVKNSAKSIGLVYFTQGNYDSSHYYFNIVIDLATKSKDSASIGIALFNIGQGYSRSGNYQAAVDYMLKAKKILDANGNKYILAQVNDRIDRLYANIQVFNKAIEYGNLAVKQAKELKNDALLISALGNLAIDYKELKQYEKSKTLLFEALKIAQKLGDLPFEAKILLNIGGVLLEQGDYKALGEYAKRALFVNRKLGLKSEECISLRAIAISFLQKKEFKRALEYINEAYAIADSNKYKLELGACLKVLSNIYFAKQDMVAGEKYYDRSEDLFTEIFQQNYRDGIAKYEKMYESENKDKQIKLQQAELKRQKVINYILIISAVSLLFIIVLTYITFKQKRKIQRQRISELETEKHLEATEAVMKGEDQERTRIAKDLHDGLGGMLSGIKYSFTNMKENLVMTPDNQQAFERSIDMLDSSIKEMRRVAHNMMPEALVRFGLCTALKDFCNDINQSGALKVNYQCIGLEGHIIDHTVSITLYRIVQELLNNTMKHAQAKSAIVQVTKVNEQLSVTVEDDGKGFDTQLLKMNKGIGWLNIQNRVEFLKGKLDITSKECEGTSVQIELNL